MLKEIKAKKKIVEKKTNVYVYTNNRNELELKLGYQIAEKVCVL